MLQKPHSPSDVFHLLAKRLALARRQLLRKTAQVIALNALLSGGADIANYIPWVNMAEFEKNPKFVFQSNKEDGFIMLDLRVDRPPFDNPKLRQAISYGLDRDALMKTAASGRGRRS